MLEKIIFGIYFMLILGGVMLISMLIALITQAIVYRTTKISIYKILKKSLIK